MSLFDFIKVDRFFNEGQGCFERNELDSAVDLYSSALEINPNYSGIYLHKAKALSKLGRYAEAETAINKAIELKPESDVYYLFAGIIHLENNNIQKAKECFRKSLELCSDYTFAKQWEALAILFDGETKRGIDVLMKESMASDNKFHAVFYVFLNLFRKKNDADVQLLKELGRVYFDAKEEKVKTRQDSDLDNKEKYFSERYDVAQQLIDLGEYKEAIELCESMLKKGPEPLFRFKYSILLAGAYSRVLRHSDCEEIYKSIKGMIFGDFSDLSKKVEEVDERKIYGFLATGIRVKSKKSDGRLRVEAFHADRKLLCKKMLCGDRLIFWRAYKRRRWLSLDINCQLEIDRDDIAYFDYMIGEAQYYQKKLDDALESFNLAYEFSNKSVKKAMSYYKGMIYLNKNNIRQAIYDFTDAFGNAPGDSTYKDQCSSLIRQL